jgi:hypothetical protein
VTERAPPIHRLSIRRSDACSNPLIHVVNEPVRPDAYLAEPRNSLARGFGQIV